MSFPRRFKTETWFMRLPTGEVEVASASALEDAFRCGLADARTPVRSVSSPVWTTLGEVAEIARCAPNSLAGLRQSMWEAPTDSVPVATWTSRTNVDPRAFKTGARQVLRGGLAVLGFLAMVIFGGEQLSLRTAEAGMTSAIPFPAQRPPTVLPLVPRAVAPQEIHYPTPLVREQLAKVALQKRLLEADAIRRVNAAANPRRVQHRSRTVITSPTRSTPEPSSPFTHGGDPADPLNESF